VEAYWKLSYNAEYRSVNWVVLSLLVFISVLVMYPKLIWDSSKSYNLLWNLVGFSTWVFVSRMIARGGRCNAKKDLNGKIAVVTGPTAGIGIETARLLAEMGATIVLAGRGLQKLESAKLKIIQTSKKLKGSQLVPMQLDVSNLTSVREFLEAFEKKFEKLDILVNNAGIMAVPFQKTSDDLELVLATNHLGPFLLTNLLVPSLKRSSSGRIVTVTSNTHLTLRRFTFDMFMSAEKYNSAKAYPMTKLANIIFTDELQKRLQGSKVTAYCCHPGGILTDLFRNLIAGVPSFVYDAFRTIALIAVKTYEEGAQTTVYCCVDEKAVPGSYHADCQIVPCSEIVFDSKLGKEVWETSQVMILEAPTSQQNNFSKSLFL
jgi:retinol dehydrogenase-12